MAETTKSKELADPQDQWVTLEQAAHMLGLKKAYASQCLRKGFLKGKVAFRSHSGRNFQYNLKDLNVLVEQATVPSKK